MKLIDTEPAPEIGFNYAHKISENGRWEMGFRQMLFGFRVSVSKVGHGYYSVDYCCADDPTWMHLVYLVVQAILESLPEEVTIHEIEQMFPRQNTKPMVNDPACWDRLLQLAEARVLHAEESNCQAKRTGAEG